MGYAASFLAPELPEMGPCYPDWILLARRAYISDRKNATVADNHTSDGHPIQVSLFAATPPAVSHLCVHCPGKEDQFAYSPAVIFSREDLILFDVSLGTRDMSDYFIYKADSKAPSLVRIADPEPYTSGLHNTVTDASVYAPDDWTLITGSRRLDSVEWKRGDEVNIEDVTVSEDCYGHTDLLPRFCENGKPSLKKMPIGIPTFGNCNNAVYFMCKVKFEDTKGWVVAVDINSKRLDAVSTFSAATLPGFSTAYYPSSFSKYLNNNSAGLLC
ncbi:unnamed protein product [Urochloa decumbens]|uniref:DUF1618 domain-containing protein n=1 Tax=Urochloa decumbens TaxID=240449 RepID=A0ABC9DV84_9POAL